MFFIVIIFLLDDVTVNFYSLYCLCRPPLNIVRMQAIIAKRPRSKIFKHQSYALHGRESERDVDKKRHRFGFDLVRLIVENCSFVSRLRPRITDCSFLVLVLVLVMVMVMVWYGIWSVIAWLFFCIAIDLNGVINAFIIRLS